MARWYDEPKLDQPSRIYQRPRQGYRRLNVVIDHELADAVAHQAQAEMLSKSALIRRTLRRAILWAPPKKDPLVTLFAFTNFEGQSTDDFR